MVYLQKSKYGTYRILEKVKEGDKWETKQIEHLGKVSKEEAEKRLDELMPISQKKYHELINNRQWLHQKYWEEQLNTYEIANILGCGNNAIRCAFIRYGIPIRLPSEVYHLCNTKRWGKERKNNPFLNDKEWLYNQYRVERKSIIKIASGIGVGATTVKKVLLSFGVIPEGHNGNRILLGKGDIVLYENLDDKNWMQRKYVTEHLSLSGIADIIGCSCSAVWVALKRHKIKTRTVKESIKHRKQKKICPNNPEKKFIEICNKNDLPYKFTGDGSFRIENLNPDFVNVNGKKICVEIFGDYWHSPLLNRNIRRDMIFEERKRVFKKYGWKMVVLWERDLLRNDAESFILNHLEKEKAI